MITKILRRRVIFHFDCWKEFFNKQVLKKAQNNVKMFQEKAKALFSQLAGSGVLANISGIDHLKSLLGKDIGEFEGGLPRVDEMFGGEIQPDFIGDDPKTMTEGTIIPMPKKTLKKNGKRKPKAKAKV